VAVGLPPEPLDLSSSTIALRLTVGELSPVAESGLGLLDREKLTRPRAGARFEREDKVMGFSAKQVQALRRHLSTRHIRTREAHGRELSYLEGWYAISEANRIFGFDGWNRETVETRCVLARENRGFLAVYIARVRVTVHADGATIIREGHGTGEGHGTSPGEVHDIAFKAAETDATKRALATFGRPFGLALYGSGKASSSAQTLASGAKSLNQAHHQVRLPPDDTTPEFVEGRTLSSVCSMGIHSTERRT
jgi:hypothetical protein